MDQQKEKTNSNKVKSPVKKKSKFTNHSSRKNHKTNTFREDEKEQLEKDDKKRKKEMRNNLEKEKK